jgi:hypothetical protein
MASMADFKRIGRLNKNRGRAFERWVAAGLDKSTQAARFFRIDDLLDAGRAGLIEHDLGALDGGDVG